MPEEKAPGQGSSSPPGLDGFAQRQDQMASFISQTIPLERARQYLPFRLYHELILNPGSETIQRCVEHLSALVQTVQTYCAPPILAEAKFPHQTHGKWCEAALLFADISGFTALSERLSARGRAGAEEITRIVNRYFATMADILHQNGGARIKFGGDALLGMFAGEAQDTARRAVQAALDMQQAMGQSGDVETSTGRCKLHMKIGIHTGRVFTAHVGTAAQMEYWVTGNDVNLTALAEETSRERQVVISEAARRHLAGWVDTTPLILESPDQPVFHLVAAAQPYPSKPVGASRDSLVPLDMPGLVRRLDTLTSYLPKGLLPRLVYNPRSRRIDSEHRLVAVLFINVVGFSELAEALAPEQTPALTETMQDYFATLQSIVEQHGGTINKTDLYSTGDKVLALFGAPVAHEDDVDQAARVAVAMQAALEQVNRRLAARCPTANVRLRQRMGLSTGCVFSGNVGSESWQEYTIMGDEVNLAARLMSAAKWGEILTTSHVFIWLGPFGSFDFAGDFSVKGKQRPVPIYRLKHMGETYRPKPPFVNRDEVRAIVQDHIDRLLHGQGQIVSLTGEPGIGKSRLWDELRPASEAGGGLWLIGYCREQQPTYNLPAELLRAYLKLDAADDPNVQQQVLVQKVESLFGADQVQDRCPFLAIVMGLPLADEWKAQVGHLGKRLAARLAEEVANVFERLAQAQPLVLICEDLHWIDPGSVDILLRVMELVEYAPVMLGITLRPGQYPAYQDIYRELTGRFERWYKPIAVKPLDAEHSAQVIQSILGQTVTPEFQAHILERGRGNPLFIGEMARAAITAPEATIPDRVQKIVEGRVDALAEGPRRAVKAASVIGMQFSLPELVCVLEEPERDGRRYLAELWRMQLIETKGNTHEFIHSLVREVVYSSQGDQVRRAFHRKLGAYWTQQANSQKAAYHYFAGEVWPQALEQGERAADEQREAYAHQEAVRLYRLALRAAEEVGDLAAQERLYNRLGQVYYQAGTYDLASQAFQCELELLRGKPAGGLAQAEVHCALGRVYDRWGKYDQALDELEAGLKLAGQENVTRAQLLLTRCSVLINTGKLDEAERDGLQALHIAQATGARPEEAYACNNLGAVCGTQGQYEQALEYHQRSLAIRQELDVAYEIAESLENVGTALGLLGRLDEADPHYHEALAIRERIGDRQGEGSIYQNLAWLELDRGRPEAAEAKFLRALALWKQVEYRKGVAFVYNDLGMLYLKQGRWGEAHNHLEQSAQHYEAMGANTYLPENYAALAQLYLGLGRPQDALAAAQKALAWALQNKYRRREALAYRILGEVHLASGDLAQAQLCAHMSLARAQTEPPLRDPMQAAAELIEKIDLMLRA